MYAYLILYVHSLDCSSECTMLTVLFSVCRMSLSVFRLTVIGCSARFVVCNDVITVMRNGTVMSVPGVTTEYGQSLHALIYVRSFALSNFYCIICLTDSCYSISTNPIHLWNYAYSILIPLSSSILSQYIIISQVVPQYVIYD